MVFDYTEGSGHVIFGRARWWCLSLPNFSPCIKVPLLEYHIAKTAEGPTETDAAAAADNVWDVNRR